MSEYKLGGVAALFSKPKEPKTEAGKKLQSLFKKFQDADSKWNDNSTENAKSGKEQMSKKNKRRFSAGDTNFPRKKKQKPKPTSFISNNFGEIEENEIKSNSNMAKSPKQKSGFIKMSKTKTYSNDMSQKKSSDVKSSGNKVPDFIRTPKIHNKAGKRNFENDSDDNDSNSEPFRKKSFDEDNLFGEETDEHGAEHAKKQKKKFDENSKKLPKKTEPHFKKLLKSNPKDEGEILSRTLFVGNLPVNTQINELKAVFSQYGEIEHIRFKGIETNRAKIFSGNARKSLKPNYAADSVPAFIVFKERENAVNALALCGTVFKNHHISVDFALPAGSKKLYDEKRSIFIGNLPFGAKDESIWDAFESCGQIESVRIVRDKKTGVGKGFGYVMFSTVKSKENAIALTDLTIDKRPIRIMAVTAKKTGQKSDTSTTKIDTFKSRARRIQKKQANTNTRKSIKKLVKKEKLKRKKKQIASVLQK